MYDAVIFDKDGVLLDSGLNNFKWMDDVRIEKAEKLGYSINKADSLQIVRAEDYSEIENFLSKHGMAVDELLEIEHQVQNAKINLIRQGVIRLFPEASKILGNLELPAALATNAPYKTTEFTLNYFALNNEFQTVKSFKLDKLQHYVEHKKPHPDMIKAAKSELNAANPLMVGDSRADIVAAQKAGVDSALVQSYSENPGLDPTHRVRNLAELKTLLN